MALCQTSVLKVYNAVIEDVIANVRDAFLDEGVEETVLQEMKQIWRNKLMASKAVEISAETTDPQPPQVIANNPKPSKAAAAKAKKAAAAAAAAAALNNTTVVSAATTTTGSTAGGQGSVSASGNAVGSSVDVKPHSSLLQTNSSNSKATITKVMQATSSAPHTLNNAAANGLIKQENPRQSNPPPLHPTSAASAMMQAKANAAQQQHQVTSSTGSTSMPNQPSSSNIPIVASLDPNRIMPVNITLPAQPGTLNTETRVLTIHVPASALQENQLTQILTANLISSIMTLPTTLASSVLQQHVNAALQNASMQKGFSISKQLDGALDTSDEEESEESEDNIDNEDDEDADKDEDEDIDDGGAEEEPLNSEDDVTDEDGGDLFETDNVIVCQYDKITRSRNKWKFYLKDGIMNIGGKDYVFQKSNGDAEW